MLFFIRLLTIGLWLKTLGCVTGFLVPYTLGGTTIMIDASEMPAMPTPLLQYIMGGLEKRRKKPLRPSEVYNIKESYPPFKHQYVHGNTQLANNDYGKNSYYSNSVPEKYHNGRSPPPKISVNNPQGNPDDNAEAIENMIPIEYGFDFLSQNHPPSYYNHNAEFSSPMSYGFMKNDYGNMPFNVNLLDDSNKEKYSDKRKVIHNEPQNKKPSYSELLILATETPPNLSPLTVTPNIHGISDKDYVNKEYSGVSVKHLLRDQLNQEEHLEAMYVNSEPMYESMMPIKPLQQDYDENNFMESNLENHFRNYETYDAIPRRKLTATAPISPISFSGGSQSKFPSPKYQNLDQPLSGKVRSTTKQEYSNNNPASSSHDNIDESNESALKFSRKSELDPVTPDASINNQNYDQNNIVSKDSNTRKNPGQSIMNVSKYNKVNDKHEVHLPQSLLQQIYSRRKPNRETVQKRSPVSNENESVSSNKSYIPSSFKIQPFSSHRRKADLEKNARINILGNPGIPLDSLEELRLIHDVRQIVESLKDDGEVLPNHPIYSLLSASSTATIATPSSNYFTYKKGIESQISPGVRIPGIKGLLNQANINRKSSVPYAAGGSTSIRGTASAGATGPTTTGATGPTTTGGSGSTSPGAGAPVSTAPIGLVSPANLLVEFGGAFHDASDDLVDKDSCRCGLRFAQRVVGGAAVSISEFPWLVALTFRSNDFVFCGASLITDRHLVTAAHCLNGVSARNIYVRAGQTRRTGTATVLEVSAIVIHPKYKDGKDFDIAVVTLEKPVEFSPTLLPICMPSHAEPADAFKDGVVAGWGRIQDGGKVSKRLRTVTVNLMTSAECRNQSNYGSKDIHSRIICASAPNKDACQGDSGGPLMVSNRNNIEIIGVVSWGVGCADENYPGIYTRVYPYRTWIKSRTRTGIQCNKDPLEGLVTNYRNTEQFYGDRRYPHNIARVPTPQIVKKYHVPYSAAIATQYSHRQPLLDAQDSSREQNRNMEYSSYFDSQSRMGSSGDNVLENIDHSAVIKTEERKSIPPEIEMDNIKYLEGRENSATQKDIGNQGGDVFTTERFDSEIFTTERFDSEVFTTERFDSEVFTTERFDQTIKETTESAVDIDVNTENIQTTVMHETIEPILKENSIATTDSSNNDAEVKENGTADETTTENTAEEKEMSDFYTTQTPLTVDEISTVEYKENVLREKLNNFDERYYRFNLETNDDVASEITEYSTRDRSITTEYSDATEMTLPTTVVNEEYPTATEGGFPANLFEQHNSLKFNIPLTGNNLDIKMDIENIEKIIQDLGLANFNKDVSFSSISNRQNNKYASSESDLVSGNLITVHTSVAIPNNENVFQNNELIKSQPAVVTEVESNHPTHMMVENIAIAKPDLKIKLEVNETQNGTIYDFFQYRNTSTNKVKQINANNITEDIMENTTVADSESDSTPVDESTAAVAITTVLPDHGAEISERINGAHIVNQHNLILADEKSNFTLDFDQTEINQTGSKASIKGVLEKKFNESSRENGTIIVELDNVVVGDPNFNFTLEFNTTENDSESNKNNTAYLEVIDSIKRTNHSIQIELQSFEIANHNFNFTLDFKDNSSKINNSLDGSSEFSSSMEEKNSTKEKVNGTIVVSMHNISINQPNFYFTLDFDAVDATNDKTYSAIHQAVETNTKQVEDNDKDIFIIRSEPKLPHLEVLVGGVNMNSGDIKSGFREKQQSSVLDYDEQDEIETNRNILKKETQSTLENIENVLSANSETEKDTNNETGTFIPDKELIEGQFELTEDEVSPTNNEQKQNVDVEMDRTKGEKIHANSSNEHKEMSEKDTDSSKNNSLERADVHLATEKTDSGSEDETPFLQNQSRTKPSGVYRKDANALNAAIESIQTDLVKEEEPNNFYRILNQLLPWGFHAENSEQTDYSVAPRINDKRRLNKKPEDDLNEALKKIFAHKSKIYDK